MTNTLEMKLSIIPAADAIAKYFEYYPSDILTKVRLTHRGPFYIYSFLGNDGKSRHLLKLNAQNGGIIKNKTKTLRGKRRDPIRREMKKLNLEGILSLTEANDVALKTVPDATPVKWKLERKKSRTLWKIKLIGQSVANMHKVKIDAQNGSLIQVKLKH